MEKINLQDKTKPKTGKGEIYWFENENIGLEKTLFHRFYIPLIEFLRGSIAPDCNLIREVILSIHALPIYLFTHSVLCPSEQGKRTVGQP